MAAAYKFLNSEHIDTLLSGSVLISSLAYFRYLERVYKDSMIGDQLEGQSERVQTSPITIGGGRLGEAERQAISRAGIYVAPGADTAESRATISGNVFVYQEPHSLIFSLAQGELQRCIETFCREPPTPEDRYDACVAIKDVAALEQAIWQEATVANLDGRRVPDVFERIESGAVIYGEKRVDLLSDHEPASGVFAKTTMYKQQSEFRIVLRPRDRLERDKLCLQLKNPERHFEEVFRNYNVGHKSRSAPRTARPLADVRAACVEFHRRHSSELSKRFDSMKGDEFTKYYMQASAGMQDEGFRLLWEARLLGYRFESDMPYMGHRAGNILGRIEGLSTLLTEVLNGSSKRAIR